MLILENIRKKDDIIRADFSFPGIEGSGSIVYDARKREVINAEFGDKSPKEVYGFWHLVKVLNMMIDAGKFPTKYEYCWY